MASYTIPETVIGIPLFVPSANNFFTVDPAGMPNGDPCLKISGDVNRDYKAFCNAPALTPDVFRRCYQQSDSVSYSIVFWIKITSYGSMVLANTPYAQTLLSVASAGWTPVSGNYGFNFAFANWQFQATNAGIQCVRPIAQATTDDLRVNRISTMSAGVWHMVTMTVGPTAGGGSIYLDDQVTTTETAFYGTDTAGTATNTGFKFCVGSYSDLGEANGAPIEWRLGKFSVHDHMLNSTERSLLYLAMTA